MQAMQLCIFLYRHVEGILGFSHWEVTGAMTLHPCPDDFFQDFVLGPFQSSSMSSLSDSMIIVICHMSYVILHMSYVICHHWEVTDALTVHWLCIVNASSGVLMSSPRYISKISINPNDTTLHYFCNLSSNLTQAKYNLTQHNDQRVDME